MAPPTARLLQGQVGIVTGAARGIGRGITLGLAAAGANVVVAARDMEAAGAVVDEIVASGGAALAVTLDLRDPATIPAMVATTLERFGHIDLLVNNSGIGGPSCPLWEVDPDQWQETFDINVTGAFLCCRAVVPHMIERGTGSIIFVGSITGKQPMLHRAPYAASKMALVGLCRTLALDVGSHGLRVNLVSPGFVEGERLDWVVEGQAEARGQPVAEVRGQMERQSVLQHFVSSSDVAGAVIFLASDLASSISGVDLNVAAGTVMF